MSKIKCWFVILSIASSFMLTSCKVVVPTEKTPTATGEAVTVTGETTNEMEQPVPMAVETMKKGALDFIQKPFDEAKLIALVEKMQANARTAFANHQKASTRDMLMGKLTNREAQVLERIVAGRLNKQIADDLNISIKTVEAHRANIMEKFRANTVADLLKIALGADAQPPSN